MHLESFSFKSLLWLKKIKVYKYQKKNNVYALKLLAIKSKRIIT